MPLSSPKTLSPPSVTVPGGNRSPSVRMTQLLRRMASAPEKPATALPLLASRAAMRLSGSAHTIGNASRFALASITERFHASSAFCFVSSDKRTPNTPAAAVEGVIFYACSVNCDKAQQEAFLRYMAPAGKLFPLAEELHAAGAAVAGCGPAFAAIFLESMADGGVACGLPRASASQYAAQMMLGTAKMVRETGQHPGVLKDSVCSPAGSTIQGVQTLEKCGMRAAVFDAVTVAYEKNVELKKASD